MTRDEKLEFDRLEAQLKYAKQNVEDTRVYLLSALRQSNSETRFYRSLFWALLTVAFVLTIFGLLR